jgi:hypothetical protein
MSTPEEQAVFEPEQRRGIGGLQVALILLGVILLILVLWWLFLRGGEDEVTTTAPPAPAPATTPAPAVTDDKEDGEKRPLETFEVFAPKDPFDPLITEDEGGTTDGDTTGDGTTTDTGTGTDGDGDGVVDDGGTTDGDGDGDGAADVRGHTVELVATLDGGSAQVQVDSTVYRVSEGEQFAQNFELVSVSGDCATLLYGDDQFTLCEGEEILK